MLSCGLMGGGGGELPTAVCMSIAVESVGAPADDWGETAAGEPGGEEADPTPTMVRSPVVRMMATGRAIGGSGAGGSIVLYGTGDPRYWVGGGGGEPS